MNAYRYLNPVKTSPGVLTCIYIFFTTGIISIEVDIHSVYQLAFAANVRIVGEGGNLYAIEMFK